MEAGYIINVVWSMFFELFCICSLVYLIKVATVWKRLETRFGRECSTEKLTENGEFWYFSLDIEAIFLLLDNLVLHNCQYSPIHYSFRK